MMDSDRGQRRSSTLLRVAVVTVLVAILLSAFLLTAHGQVVPTPPLPSPMTEAALTTPSPAPTATPEPSPTSPPPAATVPDPSTATADPTETPAPTATPQPRAGLPVRLRIPAAKVDAGIEQVGLTPEKAMDTPKSYANTGWYKFGARPGEQGNAVIDGHVDSKTGIAVFWYLRDLKPGDEIYVLGDDGVERKFIVTRLESYKGDEAPLNEIFGSAPGVHLNLITCDGVFDKKRQEYDKRLVVYSDAAP